MKPKNIAPRIESTEPITVAQAFTHHAQGTRPAPRRSASPEAEEREPDDELREMVEGDKGEDPGQCDLDDEDRESEKKDGCIRRAR